MNQHCEINNFKYHKHTNDVKHANILLIYNLKIFWNSFLWKAILNYTI